MSEILFAEDDADIRKWVAVALETEGYIVRTVPDGEAALAAYAAQRPDLLMLDIMMPKRDGVSVCAEIRRRDAALPILMLTARTAERDKIAGLGAEAEGGVGARLTVIAPDGTETPLAAREYELLRLLAAHPGEVLRRDDILDELWGVAFHGNTRTLDQHVALVRRKLGADAARIETVRNVGYRLA